MFPSEVLSKAFNETEIEWHIKMNYNKYHLTI